MSVTPPSKNLGSLGLVIAIVAYSKGTFNASSRTLPEIVYCLD
ncbi:hypothetical protein [Gillisia marina]|nr:hypothetical protein [Gillisia marina]